MEENKTKCQCACHENKLNQPYEHDRKCCDDMNGTVPSPTNSLCEEIEKVADIVRGEPADGFLEREEVIEVIQELVAITKQETQREAFQEGAQYMVDENTSDGYHTFKELYEFRKLYNALLFNEWAASGKYDVHKSKRHSDGNPCFDGTWFIVVAQLPTGQISNHYEMKDWDLFKCEERPVGAVFDGHTPKDVADRMLSSLTNPDMSEGEVQCNHICTSNCRRVGCNCECGEYHEI